MDTNVKGVVWVTNAMLPLLRALGLATHRQRLQ
ncbi:NADP-dependent 3-hydroxy acid dehydrogenase YdfG [Streptomyces phaeoluteigriseus]